jgi:hypothetical protein
MPTRTPEEIRAAIEQNRKDLAVSIGTLKAEVAEATDWRKHLVAHQQNAMIGAAVAGFVLTGGLAAVGGLFRRKRG